MNLIFTILIHFKYVLIIRFFNNNVTLQINNFSIEHITIRMYIFEKDKRYIIIGNIIINHN